jgi:hypothetical protein
MDLGKIGGYAVIGGCVLLAAADGALLALLAAVGAGFAVCKLTSSSFNTAEKAVCDDAVSRIEKYGTAMKDEDGKALAPAQIKAREYTAKQRIAEVVENYEKSKPSTSDLAKIMGFGTFVFPVAGIVTALGGVWFAKQKAKEGKGSDTEKK